MINHYKMRTVEIELVPIELLRLSSRHAQANAVYLASFIGNKSIGLEQKMSPEEKNNLEGLREFMRMEDEAQFNTSCKTLIHWKQYDENIRPLISFLLNISLDKGQTALHLVGKYEYNNGNDYFLVARILIENHANVNQRDNDGQTPLHWAAASGRREIIKLLIKHGADINATRKDGATPVMLAVNNGKYGIARFLIEDHGANPEGIVLPTGPIRVSYEVSAFSDLRNAITNFRLQPKRQGPERSPSSHSNKPSS